MLAVELKAVTKTFGSKVAVDGISMSLPAGSFLGLLGRNGAGKSTTLKMVTGLIPPTSGEIHLLGLDLARDPMAVKRQIGTMPEDMGLLDQLTGDVPKDGPPPMKSAAAVALGRLGGMKGGAARAEKLTAEQRSEIAKKAAAGRWSKKA